VHGIRDLKHRKKVLSDYPKMDLSDYCKGLLHSEFILNLGKLKIDRLAQQNKAF